MNFNRWDIALLIIIPIQATIMAYIYHPRLKGIISIIPLPFTLATLSLGRRLDSTNAAGILLVMFYVHSVRLLSNRLRVPIVAAIVLSASGYCFLSSLLVKIIPENDTTFWTLITFSFIIGIALNIFSHGKEESGYRSPLPVAVKWLVITCVIFILIIIKKHLLGFMTLFPMVGVVAAYELRYSLWTYCRNVHIFILAGSPMMMTMYLTQERFGMGAALAAGWVVLLLIAIPAYTVMFNRKYPPA